MWETDVGLPRARGEIVAAAILGKNLWMPKSAHIPLTVSNDCGRGAQDQRGRRKPGMHNGEAGFSGDGSLFSGAPFSEFWGIPIFSEPFSTVDTCIRNGPQNPPKMRSPM